jgi:hypothetical protein
MGFGEKILVADKAVKQAHSIDYVTVSLTQAAAKRYRQKP